MTVCFTAYSTRKRFFEPVSTSGFTIGAICMIHKLGYSDFCVKNIAVRGCTANAGFLYMFWHHVLGAYLFSDTVLKHKLNCKFIVLVYIILFNHTKLIENILCMTFSVDGFFYGSRQRSKCERSVWILDDHVGTGTEEHGLFFPRFTLSH
jgi:hypothetical protein